MVCRTTGDEDAPHRFSTYARHRSGAEALRLVNVTWTHGTDDSTVTARDGVAPRLRRGAFTAVTGPSGSGKSALLQGGEAELTRLRAVVAAPTGTVPFTVVRTDSVLPHRGLGIRTTVTVIAAAATIGRRPVTARRVLCTPAVEAGDGRREKRLRATGVTSVTAVAVPAPTT